MGDPGIEESVAGDFTDLLNEPDTKPDSTAATIEDEAVTNAKLAHVATQTIKGRATAATGEVEDLTIPQAQSLLGISDGSGLYFCQGFAISDETTALTTGTKLTIYLPVSLTDITVAGCVTTAPTGASLIIDIHKAGTTIMTTNKIEIDVSEFSTNTAATAPTVTTTTYTAFDKLEFIIDQVGSTVAGAGAKVFIIGNIV